MKTSIAYWYAVRHAAFSAFVNATALTTLFVGGSVMAAQTDNRLLDLQIGETPNFLRLAIVCATPCEVTAGPGGDLILEGIEAQTTLDLAGRSRVARSLTVSPTGVGSHIALESDVSLGPPDIRRCTASGLTATCLDYALGAVVVDRQSAGLEPEEESIAPLERTNPGDEDDDIRKIIKVAENAEERPAQEGLIRSAPPEFAQPRADHAARLNPVLRDDSGEEDAGSEKVIAPGDGQGPSQRIAAANPTRTAPIASPRLERFTPPERFSPVSPVIEGERAVKTASNEGSPGNGAEEEIVALTQPPVRNTQPAANTALAEASIPSLSPTHRAATRATVASAALPAGAQEALTRGRLKGDVRLDAAQLLGVDLSDDTCLDASRRLQADGWALDAMVDVGFCKAAAGRYAAADEDFRRLLSYTPDNYRALVGRGLIAATTGDDAIAREYLQAALDAAPPLQESRRIAAAINGLKAP